MKTTVFSTHQFEKPYLESANNDTHELKLLEVRLTENTAPLGDGSEAISLFTSDDASEGVLEKLSALGVKYIALRTAGYNNVAIEKAKELGITVSRVPAYSPYAIAEHTVALILALNRKLIRSHNRVRDMNFSLNGLTGFDMNGKTVGVMGTGKIGKVLIKILHGFGCKILAYDLEEVEELKEKYGVRFTDCLTLCSKADIISLHVPFTPETKHIIDAEHIRVMKKGVMLINTSRGALVDTKAVINGLKSGKIGYFGIDVYEEEEGLFFEDHSDEILQDDVIARLMTFSNVLITSHQAFLTDTALTNIADTTIYNLDCFEKGIASENEIPIKSPPNMH
ncbi:MULTISPECIES: 2-hydroxyacid dehydrogenase [unclassified Arenibacter]|jgi:D-lactate dehydrogenase|uniref:2-hydroxyacid dehydrogenase n=1 Tax=unclassified Arenibacter TaxID=2615047 RepID=UPI000E34F8CE|nr:MULTISPECIES: 2-hydroxyacid dehydrogenase [unclassified Arenibacter]MCM4164880.1 hydroxyacid dehydrogenase [Arenibacter sp. A80]RFT55295.1 2-hydroxyacid dehydrogenase [Arenibacter sp. P308M17]|tara:strand:- start:111 stop:1124 length:1014 start_codon:yes stop_codon:yes gene_type:complete